MSEVIAPSVTEVVVPETQIVENAEANGNLTTTPELFPVSETETIIDQVKELDISSVEPEVDGVPDAGSALSEQDTNLVDIINSMEADRKKFIAHVHTKIAKQDSEFEVITTYYKYN